ncbi:MAG: hypothetical protein AB7F19_07110 [Candidatus Babeliales bacterium]
MKTICASLFCAVSLLASCNILAITVNLANDSREHINVRMRFRDQKTNELYWSDWVYTPDKASITSKNPGDAIFGFSILGAQASQQLSVHEHADEEQPKGITYLLTDFHSPSNKLFSEIAQNAKITIRDAKIEITTTLPEENLYWTGEYIRR